MPGPDIDRDKLRAMIDKPGDEYDELAKYNRKKPPSRSAADRHTGKALRADDRMANSRGKRR